jgi:hypothetical protein
MSYSYSSNAANWVPFLSEATNQLTKHQEGRGLEAKGLGPRRLAYAQ